jgi:hypothetical protein
VRRTWIHVFENKILRTYYFWILQNPFSQVCVYLFFAETRSQFPRKQSLLRRECATKCSSEKKSCSIWFYQFQYFFLFQIVIFFSNTFFQIERFKLNITWRQAQYYKHSGFCAWVQRCMNSYVGIHFNHCWNQTLVNFIVIFSSDTTYYNNKFSFLCIRNT